MVMPVHKFIADVFPQHIGYPAGAYKGQAGIGWNYQYSPASIGVLRAAHCLEHGINHSRVIIAYTAGQTTAVLTWLDGATHDFKVGEWVNLRGYGGVTTNNVEGYYRVASVASSTELTLTVPVSFSPSTGTSGHVLENPTFGYDHVCLTGTNTLTEDLCKNLRTITTWTNNGASLTSVTAKFGSTALDFSGSSIKYIAGAEDALRNPKYDFTMEAWVYSLGTVDTAIRVIGWWLNGAQGLVLSNGNLCWYEAVALRAASDTALPTNQWVHVAATRKAGVISLFVNGVKQTGSYANSTSENTDNYILHIGGSNVANTNFPGYIQHFVLKQGVAAYTATFTPSATRILPTRPGVGYFACRGGNMVQRVNDIPNVNYGYSTQGSGYNLFVFRFVDAFAQFGASAQAFYIGTLQQTNSYNETGYIIGRTNGTTNLLGGFGAYSAGLSTEPYATAIDCDLSFIGSSAGAYAYMERTGYTGALNASLAYLGKTLNLNDFDEAVPSIAELAQNGVLFSPSTEYWASYYAGGSSNGYANYFSGYTNASNSGRGLLQAGYVSTGFTANPIGTGISISAGDGSVVYTQPFSGSPYYIKRYPVLLSAAMCAYSRQFDSTSTALIANFSIENWDRIIAPLDSSFCPLLPGLSVQYLGIPSQAILPNARPFLIEYDEAVGARVGVMLHSSWVRSLLSLDPYDWETLP